MRAHSLPFQSTALIGRHREVAAAQVMGVRGPPETPLQDLLIRHLSRRRTLILLNNFEHLLAAAPEVAHLLDTCPSLRVLVTSRATLHLEGEHLFPIPPLELPDASRRAAPETLSGCESVALFVERAQAVNPDFGLNPRNAAAVAGICRRLEGIPLAIELAIELAAARVNLLTSQAMLEKLDRRLDLITGGTRHALARHLTPTPRSSWTWQRP